jgi:hypothetical protein
MVLRITEHCDLACKHCFIDASRKGQHMSMDTYIKTIECVRKLKPRVLLISGGEPTGHPEYLRMLGHAIVSLPDIKIIVISNGMWLKDDNKLRMYLDEFPTVEYQIVNDKRYYNKLLDVPSTEAIAARYKQLHLFWYISSKIYPQGRARSWMKVTEDTAECIGTRCFNLRSILNKYRDYSMSEAINQLELMGKFCQPSINIDGTIVGGESNDCPRTTGSITMSDKQLGDLMRSSSCNDCGMLNKLSPVHHAAVNYIHVTN